MNLSNIKVSLLIAALCAGSAVAPVNAAPERSVFPHKVPTEKPDIPLSAAMERMFEYDAPRPQDSEFYTQFKYSRLQGFDYNGGDGTITRRDPSRPILVDGKYYIYYTKRHTKVPPVGAANAAQATDEIPSTDWDLADLWYATSTDGVTWAEQGVAVPRPAKPHPGHRSVATPDILIWKGKYYLYYQAFNEPSGLKGDHSVVTVSWADSPEGPWTPLNKAVITPGQKGDWDQSLIHDPMPIVYNDQIYVYFKSTYNKWPDNRKNYHVAHGLAISDDPLKTFKKHPLNPVINSGHETFYFPFKSGVAGVIIRDGIERNTVQYAEDGVNFKIQANISLPPIAGGPYTPDAFTNTDNGRGVTWGISHFINFGPKRHSELLRFDCDLSLDMHDPAFKSPNIWFKPEVYFNSLGLSKKQLEARKAKAKNVAQDSNH
ncbi:glycoside hydrolase family 117 protein [Gayadomonas joobiniege]|uniref:glycoside hydrolase family 117 protein n=1 Tax=Gayadomonas joobiniege TaxID=1234606 RepID=UPI00036100FB|nr:family 43 glycosylhydrolase [Gayadomonas joobiniege]